MSNSTQILALHFFGFKKKTSTKGISSSKCDVGNWIFEKLLGNFLDLFGKFCEFFRSIFWEECFGRNVFEDFFGRIFWEEFFGKNFLGGFFWRIFLGGFFWEDFLGGFFWEEFFGRNYLVEINKELMFLSRFWDSSRSRKDKNLDPKKCEASSYIKRNTFLYKEMSKTNWN